MNENEQIEEMARLMEEPCVGSCKACEYYPPRSAMPCMHLKRAKIIYFKGYRKVERGEWIAKPQEFYIGDTEWMCSVCKEEFCPLDMVQDDFFRMMKFCPNCGADMRGEEG